MVRRNSIIGNIDWISVLIWVVLLIFGWMNIYSAGIMEAEQGALDFSQRFGKQIIWIIASLNLAFLLLVLDAKFYLHFSYVLYAGLILILLSVLLVGKEINGAKSWFVLGGFQLQPSEFAKPITALALAKLFSTHNFNLKHPRDLFKAGGVILLPPVLILLQPDLGSTMVYFAFIFVLFREGFPAGIILLFTMLIVLFLATLLLDKVIILLLLYLVALMVYAFSMRSVKKTMYYGLVSAGFFGLLFIVNRLTNKDFSLYILGLATLIPLMLLRTIKSLLSRQYGEIKIVVALLVAILFTVSVDFTMHKLLKPHQQHRIYVTLGLEDDPQGVGYNVNQSKIAIGSGGFRGKGYLNGTQTKLHFVPEQSTDFIFCTVGEEWGFLGTGFLILLYLALLLRMVMLAERQRSTFSRVFGYSYVSILFIHFLINIGMTIGLLPVIGIPLPYFSYGGSSLWAFTMFLFIFLRLDASRLELLR